MARSVRVLLADGYPVMRTGLANALGFEADIKIVGQAGDAIEATDKALELKPDVIIMEIFMPRGSGLEAIATIKQSLPSTRVLIFTTSDREEDLFQALRSGAQGCLLKSATIDEVVDAVRRIASGETMLSPAIATKIAAEFWERADESKLSSRQMEVLKLLGEGLTTAEIGERLFISESTVRTHLRRLLAKLNLRNRTEATAYVVRHKLTS